MPDQHLRSEVRSVPCDDDDLQVIAAELAGNRNRSYFEHAVYFTDRLLHFEGGARHAGADCGLVQVPAGARYPLHRHLGEEWVFVLSGSAEEEGTGETWGPGDLYRRPGGSSHAFRAIGSHPFVFAIVLREGIALEEPPAPSAV